MSDDATFLHHEPCPKCESKDNLARYSDGHGYCFGCQHHEHGDGTAPAVQRRSVPDLIEGDYRAIESRRLHAATLQKYDYRRGVMGGVACHAATYYDKDGVAVAQKIRLPNKVFSWVGEPKRVGLYGMHLFKAGGRKVVVTEGEIDCLSMSQVQDLKWPVVSVPNGAAGAAKSVAKCIDWLETFETVVFMFDNDEPGRAAAKECAELLSPGKGHVAELPLKDANEMLVAGRTAELVTAMWNARVYRPDGIIAGKDLWDVVSSEDNSHSIPYPWQDLNLLTHGMRLGEIVTWCAGTKVGKSTACREIAHYLVKRGEMVGYVALEESLKHTARGFLSIEMDRPLHISRDGVTTEMMQAAFDATLGTDKVFIYDHWGSIESDNLIRKVRQLVRGCGVKWVILDHISIVVSGNESANERKDLDVAMTKLRMLAEELNIGIHLVSHLKRREGKGHEDGARVSLSDLRGSQAIAQLSDLVIALERDLQSEERANVVQLRVLANRFSGDTGKAGALKYHKDTGRLLATDPFEDEDGNEHGRDRGHVDF